MTQTDVTILAIESSCDDVVEASEKQVSQVLGDPARRAGRAWSWYHHGQCGQ